MIKIYPSPDALLELNVKLNVALSYIKKLYKDSGICTETTEEKIQKKAETSKEHGKKTESSYHSQEVKSTTHIIEVEEREKKSSKTDLKRKRPSLKLKQGRREKYSTDTVIVEGHRTIPKTIQEQLNGMFLILKLKICASLSTVG